MFFIGVMDDLIELSALKKLIAQLVSALIIVFFADIRITSLCGLFGVYELPYTISCMLTIMAIITIINAYNLIDGIDGLAAGIGIIAAVTLGSVFLVLQDYLFAVLSFTLLGSLAAFFYYNFSPAKIFMGDTGSLIVGALLSILMISFVELNVHTAAVALSLPAFVTAFLNLGVVTFDIGDSALAIAMAVLIIPLFDIVRVFMSRIARKMSPFQAERNHIHHKLIDLGLNHRKASLMLYFANIAFVVIAFILKDLSATALIFTLLLLAAVSCHLLIVIHSRRCSHDHAGEMEGSIAANAPRYITEQAQFDVALINISSAKAAGAVFEAQLPAGDEGYTMPAGNSLSMLAKRPKSNPLVH